MSLQQQQQASAAEVERLKRQVEEIRQVNQELLRGSELGRDSLAVPGLSRSSTAPSGRSRRFRSLSQAHHQHRPISVRELAAPRLSRQADMAEEMFTHVYDAKKDEIERVDQNIVRKQNEILQKTTRLIRLEVEAVLADLVDQCCEEEERRLRSTQKGKMYMRKMSSMDEDTRRALNDRAREEMERMKRELEQRNR